MPIPLFYLECSIGYYTFPIISSLSNIIICGRCINYLKPVSKDIARSPIKSFLEKEIELVTEELNESLSKVYILKAVKARLMMALENAGQSRS